jgi:hypothetical protein
MVQRIFHESVEECCGADIIARRLNNSKIKPFGRAKSWHRSYILKILSNPATIGTMTPRFKRHEGVRKAAADPILNYYPAVIIP